MFEDVHLGLVSRDISPAVVTSHLPPLRDRRIIKLPEPSVAQELTVRAVESR